MSTKLSLGLFLITALSACGEDDKSSEKSTGNECVDEAYRETLPNPSASISSYVSSYSPASAEEFILDVLAARYPTGAHIVSSALDEDSQNCIDYFGYDLSSADDAIGNLSTIVHECGHFLDNARGGFSDDVFVFTSITTFECKDGDTTERGGNTFARSRINEDEFADARPPCSQTASNDCDFYADVYLSGDPDDQSFDSGDQGFNLLLEEAVQYVNSLATAYAFADDLNFMVSERDGILTMLWYIERYLRMARLDYPEAYDFLLDDPCYTEAILTLWGRAWLYLDLTKNMSNLGIDDDVLLDLVNDADLLDEIERVRAATGCRD